MTKRSTAAVKGVLLVMVAAILLGLVAVMATGQPPAPPAVIFGQYYFLTVTKAGAGAGTVTSDVTGINCGATCLAPYVPNTSVTLTAAPASGSTFTGWTGACSGTGPCVVPLSTAQNVTATFASSQFQLTVAKAGTGSGTVTGTGINCGSDCTELYNAGTVTALTATPTGGSTFTSWAGACSGSGACNVTMSAAQNVTATFTAPSGGTASVESWCTANPTICHCSRTFQTTGAWTTDTNATWWGQNNESTAANVCGTNINGRLSVLTGGSGAPVQVSSGLASGVSATEFTYKLDLLPQATPTPGRRVGIRYYHWWGSGYQSTSIVNPTTLCSNDKYAQLGDYLTAYDNRFESSALSHAGEGFNGWTPINRIGRWVMIEHYIQVYSNAPTFHEYYMTDLAAAQTFNFTSASYLSGTPSEPFNSTSVIHRYRAGPCAGVYRVMFAVMASWPTNAGQRIPAASEVVP